MAVPAVVAGSARVVKGAGNAAAQKAGSRRGLAEDGSSQQGTARTLHTIGRTRALRHNIESKNGSAKGAVHEIKAKARALRASFWIAGLVFSFYIVQLSFGILALLGAAAEFAGEQIFWGLGAWLVPGDWLWGVANIIATTVAALLMGVAAFIYTLMGVKWWSGIGLVWFIVCFTLCFVPLLNIFPILAIWMAAVIYSQK